MPRVPFHTIFQPLSRLDRRVEVHSEISNRNSEHITKLWSICVFQPHILPLHRAQFRLKIYEDTPPLMPQVPFHSIFQPPSCLDRQVRVRLEISNQKPNYIAHPGSSSEISQETSMAHSEHIPSYHTSKIPSFSPSHTPFSNCIPSHPLPHTHPTTHINHPLSLLPLAPPLLHLTHGL